MKPQKRLCYLHHPYYHAAKGPVIIRCSAVLTSGGDVRVTDTDIEHEAFNTEKRGYSGWSDMLVVDVESGEIVHRPTIGHIDELLGQCPEPDSALMAMVIAQLIKEGIYDERKTSGTGADTSSV